MNRVIDLNQTPNAKEVVQILHDTSCLIVKDESINFEYQESFKKLMHDYFIQPTEDKLKDARPETGYQIGVTPEGMEVSRCSKDPLCLDFINQHNLPIEVSDKRDPKWRFFWRVGKTDNVIPDKFNDEWESVMNTWGEKMVNVVSRVTKLIEEGLGIKKNLLLSKLEGGHHLLAPTGTDLQKYNQKGTVYASFHTDISFLSIHGKSNSPGLRVWLRTGEQITVSVPDGCLLLQVGRQLEWLTGGYFKAGYHDVIRITDHTDKLWRVSSTLFTHINEELYLYPIDGFENNKYPRIKEKDFIDEELRFTNLLLVE